MDPTLNRYCSIACKVCSIDTLIKALILIFSKLIIFIEIVHASQGGGPLPPEHTHMPKGAIFDSLNMHTNKQEVEYHKERV